MTRRIRFGVYELDLNAEELRKHGVPMRLQDQPFRVLAMLAEQPGETISREQLQTRIWGNTFVDFDHSLNKAINKIREALQDDAARPQYIETVPRRGYRFIAPVFPETPPAETPSPEPQAIPSSPVVPGKHRSFPLGTALSGLFAVVVLAIAATAWLRRPAKHAWQEPRHITAFGVAPALSRDGKLLAYTSSLGAGTPRVWVQQTAGGEPVPVTSENYASFSPDFSPDGTHIVFYSFRNGGGIYIAPTLPGDARLIASTPTGATPRFSPSGDRILYLQGDGKLFVVPVEGGDPVLLPQSQAFRLSGTPMWAPSGKEILFCATGTKEPETTAAWWIAPLFSAKTHVLSLPGLEQNDSLPRSVRAWVRDLHGREWIVYSTAALESWKLWRVGVSEQAAVSDNAELIASGSGSLGVGGSASEDGKVAYNLWSSTRSIYQVAMDLKGQKLGPTIQLPLAEGGSHSSPSTSHDGKSMVYDSDNAGKPNSIVLRSLGSGADHLLDDTGRMSGGLYEASISPNGSRVIFERDCKSGKWPDEPLQPLPCGFMVDAADKKPEQVCQGCTPRGFSADGSMVLLQKYGVRDLDTSRIVALDLHTRKERDFLSSADAPIFHAYFSWDDRWVVFKRSQSVLLNQPMAQLLIARVDHSVPAPETKWIAITDGKHQDDKPQFSADGNTVYFTSTRDGFLCIWSQRLDPVSKHPLGAPVAFEHFHNAAGRAGAFYPGNSDLSVARDKVVMDLSQVHSDTWMTQLQFRQE